MPYFLEVMGSNPVGCWAFFFFFLFFFFLSFSTLLLQWSVLSLIRSLKEVHLSLTMCCERNRKEMDPQLCCQGQNRLNKLRLKSGLCDSFSASRRPPSGLPSRGRRPHPRLHHRNLFAARVAPVEPKRRPENVDAGALERATARSIF